MIRFTKQSWMFVLLWSNKAYLSPSQAFVPTKHLHRPPFAMNNVHSSMLQSSFSFSTVSSLLHSTSGEMESDVITTRASAQEINPSIKINKYEIPSLSDLEGVIFDMDGTLTQPCIDFTTMRRRVYDICNQDSKISEDEKPVTSGCVLELYNYLSPEGQQKCKTVFAEIEKDALENMKFMDDMVDLVSFLDEQGIRRAVLTRNVETSLDFMQDKLLKEEGIGPFFPAVARDTQIQVSATTTRNLIPKPDPDSILHICEQWNCEPKDVIMVGDSATDDIQCANRAGCASVLLRFNGGEWDNDSGNSEEAIEVDTIPTVILERLGELKQLLQNAKKV